MSKTIAYRPFDTSNYYTTSNSNAINTSSLNYFIRNVIDTSSYLSNYNLNIIEISNIKEKIGFEFEIY